MAEIKTFEVQGNPNYAAVVVDVDLAEVVPLEGRDRVVGLKAFGMQAIVTRDLVASVSTLILFPAGAQVSEDFARENNLYRHEHLNADPTAKGYLDDNRRVKAIKFAGHRSDALAVGPSAFRYIGTDAYNTPFADHGTPFDTFMGTEVSRKYVLPVKGDGRSMASKQGQKRVRVTTEAFPEHYDTPNGFRYPQFGPGDFLHVTQKLHGTSVRIGRVPVARDLKWYERLAQRLGVKVQTHEHGVVVGSRRVTKSINGQVEGDKNHWYQGEDLWTKVTEPMHERIPENFIVYAEIVGWTPEGAPIQPGYTYGLPQGHQAVYVYRVAVVNGQGDLVDLPFPAVERFAEARGWNVVPVVWYGLAEHFDPEFFMDRRFHDEGLNAVPLSDPKSVDEGVVARADKGFQPAVAKYKSPIFLRGESAALDKGLADTEEAEALLAAH